MPTLPDCFHELVCDRDADVEVPHRAVVELASDELLKVGVRDVEHAHVGAAATPALLDHVGGCVEDRHERHRAGRRAPSRAHDVTPGANAGERETRATARLVNQCHPLERAEDLR